MNINVVNKRTFKDNGDGTIIPIHRNHTLGNPFTLHREEDRSKVIEQYKEWIYQKIKDKDPTVTLALNTIANTVQQGKVYLICFCAPKPCHGDVIKEIVINKMKEANLWIPSE